MSAYKIGIGRASAVAGLTRSMWYYSSKRDDSEVIEKLSQLAIEYPTRGFDEYYYRIRREGLKWNRKRVLRVYLELNECWSMDFMSDSLTDGRRVRVFNVIDDCNREALTSDIGLSFPARAVIETMENLRAEIGTPKYIRCDNGPEFLSKLFVNCCQRHHIEIRYTQPGKPMQNGYVERFNRFLREDILDAYYFNDIYQMREKVWLWTEDYNNNHPHSSLGNKSPKEFKPRFSKELKFFAESG